MFPQPVVALAGMLERLLTIDEEEALPDFVEQAAAWAGNEERQREEFRHESGRASEKQTEETVAMGKRGGGVFGIEGAESWSESSKRRGVQGGKQL